MIFLSTIQILAAMYVVWRSLIALNHMTRSTLFRHRAAYTGLLSAGVAAGALPLVALPNRDGIECLLTVGLAFYLYFTKRQHHVT